MNTRLQPLDLDDFKGGLATRRNPFSLADNESPDLLNIEIEPSAGFRTRPGWRRWNATDIDTPATWSPRNAKLHPISDGSFVVYVAANDQLYYAGADGIFATLQNSTDTAAVGTNASPHGCDFAPWGDTMHFGAGWTEAPYMRLVGDTTVTDLSDSSLGYNDDYTTPAGGYFPRADYVETHGSYMFAASIYDEGVHKPNRLRWSHPNQPQDWHSLDYLDIETGGGQITGLLSFDDHLLIFKTDSIWALYGYELETWQLVQKSQTVGVSTMTAFTRSQSVVFFFSSSGQSGFYAYSGEQIEDISERIRTCTDQVNESQDVWLGWMGHRLYASLPVAPPTSGTGVLNSVYVFDPEVGTQGAWMRYQAAVGTVGPIVTRSTLDTGYPMAVMDGDSGAACVVRMDFNPDVAYDVILEDETQSPFDSHYRTGWKYAGWPERRKSWRRPRYVVRVPPQDVAVRADVYWDYDSSNSHRSATGLFTAEGEALWGNFDWGDGTLWGAGEEGGQVERAPSGLGVCKAIQIEVKSDASTPGKSWGFDLIHLHYIMRRYTT